MDPATFYHKLQIQDFLQAILEDRRPLVDGVEGRKAVELIEAIYRSQRDHAPVLDAALERFEATGAWPGSLEAIDVDPATRIDPLSDAPFVFERLADGIRLSSPGHQDPEAWGKRVDENDPAADGLVWTLRR